MTHHHHDHEHGHEHGHHNGHGHGHGVVDPTISTTPEGLWALKWSFAVLTATALLQAATAIPLGIAFLFARKQPSKRFTFGYGRAEDLAGIAIVLTILFSAIFAGYESIQRLFHPQDISHLWSVVAASVVGFIGNEVVAIFRIRVGRRIGSAALIADGYHARVDGWTSLAVLAGMLGVWLGYPLADPIVGLIITIAIFGIVVQSGKQIFTRMLDGVNPHVVDEIRHAAAHVPQVKEVTDVRARWLGHRLHAEVNVTLPSQLTLRDAHSVAEEVRHQLLHHLKYLSLVVIHVDPEEKSGERHHRIEMHSHDGLPAHSHA
jgi:cation diffusion facilitator family transporter